MLKFGLLNYYIFRDKAVTVLNRGGGVSIAVDINAVEQIYKICEDYDNLIAHNF